MPLKIAARSPRVQHLGCSQRRARGVDDAATTGLEKIASAIHQSGEVGFVLPHTMRGALPHDARQSVFRGSGLLRVPGLEDRSTGFLNALGRRACPNKTAEEFRSGLHLQWVMLNCGGAGTLSWLHVRDHLSRDHILP
jgi:hypothetical protein